MLATLRQRDFALLWFGGLISLLGDWFLFIAVPFYIYQQTGSVLATSAMFAAETLPSLVFGSFAGVFVDRWDRKRALVAVNLLQTAVALTLLSSYVLSVHLWIWVAYVVVFIQAVLRLFSEPAENSWMPRLVGEEHLVPANSLIALNDNIARLVGAPLGGAVLGFMGLSTVVVVDGLSFFVAAVMIALIATKGRLPDSESAGEPAAADEIESAWAALWREWVDGLRVIRDSDLVVALFAIDMVANLSNTLRNPLLIPFIEQVLHGSAFEFGLIASVQGIGGLIGGIAIGHFGMRLKPARVILLSQLAVAVGVFLVIGFPSLALTIVVVGVLGVPAIASLVTMQMLLQTSVAERYLGRVFGARGTTFGLVGVVGYLVTGPLADTFGVIPMLATTGGLDTLAGLGALRIRQVPEPLSIDDADEVVVAKPGTD